MDYGENSCDEKGFDLLVGGSFLIHEKDVYIYIILENDLMASFIFLEEKHVKMVKKNDCIEEMFIVNFTNMKGITIKQGLDPYLL